MATPGQPDLKHTLRREFGHASNAFPLPGLIRIQKVRKVVKARQDIVPLKVSCFEWSGVCGVMQFFRQTIDYHVLGHAGRSKQKDPPSHGTTLCQVVNGAAVILMITH